MVIILAVLWDVTQMELLLAALITTTVSWAMVAIGWMGSR